MSSNGPLILVLEDSPDRIHRFEQVLQLKLPVASAVIANTATNMLALIDQHKDAAFAISLDHDLYVRGIADAGDGLQVAKYLSTLKPTCPVIIHTSNANQGRRMQGVLEAARWPVRLAGAIGENWIELDWMPEVADAYNARNA